MPPVAGIWRHLNGCGWRMCFDKRYVVMQIITVLPATPYACSKYLLDTVHKIINLL